MSRRHGPCVSGRPAYREARSSVTTSLISRPSERPAQQPMRTGINLPFSPPPPLRLAAKDGQDVRIAEGSALLHLGVFDRPDGHAYGDLAGLVALTDRFFEIVSQLLFEGHGAWGRRLRATGGCPAGWSSR